MLNHNKYIYEKKSKHVHDAFGGNGKSTSQKRWLLLTCVCYAYVFKTSNMAAKSNM